MLELYPTFMILYFTEYNIAVIIVFQNQTNNQPQCRLWVSCWLLKNRKRNMIRRKKTMTEKNWLYIMVIIFYATFVTGGALSVTLVCLYLLPKIGFPSINLVCLNQRLCKLYKMLITKKLLSSLSFGGFTLTLLELCPFILLYASGGIICV